MSFSCPPEPPAHRPTYHHGALQQALIGATEAILSEKGLEGFSLREAARRAGVSPAAPTHHFGSAAGLLTEVAVLGFEELTRFLEAGDDTGGNDPAARLRGQGMGYIRFALAYPARFRLMFRGDKLAPNDRLAAAQSAAFAVLDRAIRRYKNITAEAPLETDGSAALVGAWSVVHGFAHLMLEDKFQHPCQPDSQAEFVGQIVPVMLGQIWPSI